MGNKIITQNGYFEKPDYQSSRWDIPNNANWEEADSQLIARMSENEIINGMFDHWQRGTSFSSPVYTADRWLFGFGGATTATANRGDFDTASLGGVDAYHFVYFNITSGNGNSDFSYFEQRIPGLKRFSNKTVCVTFWAKASDTDLSISVAGIQRDSGDINNGIGAKKFNLSQGVWTRCVHFIQFPDVESHDTVTETAHNVIRFWLDAGSDYDGRTDSLGNQSGELWLCNVTATISSVDIPVRRRPVAEELILCQKFFFVDDEVLTYIGMILGGFPGRNISFSRQFNTMIAVPTVTIISKSIGTGFEDGTEFVDTISKSSASYGAKTVDHNGVGNFSLQCSFDAEL